MKRKLLNEIDFKAIEPMDDKQMVEIGGGGLKELLEEIIDIILNGGSCCFPGPDHNWNCRCDY